MSQGGNRQLFRPGPAQDARTDIERRPGRKYIIHQDVPLVLLDRRPAPQRKGILHVLFASFPIQPRLRRLQKVVAITTLGSPWWVDWVVLRQPVRRILKTAILRTCAPQASLTFLSFYKCESLSSQSFDAALVRVKTALRAL